jgi:hypothetical protein
MTEKLLRHPHERQETEMVTPAHSWWTEPDVQASRERFDQAAAAHYEAMASSKEAQRMGMAMTIGQLRSVTRQGE